MRIFIGLVYVGLVLSFNSFPVNAARYYVNDAVTSGDVFCTAPGSAGNPGNASNAPAASVMQIVNAYVLGPGDTVYVDRGSYTVSSNQVIGLADSGSSGGGFVTIQGAGSANTWFSRGSMVGSAYAFHLSNAQYVRIRDLTIQAAAQGVRIEGGTDNQVEGCALSACAYGVVLSGGADHRVGTSQFQSMSAGVLGSASPGAVIEANSFSAMTNAVDLSLGCNGAQITGNTATECYSNACSVSSCSGIFITGNRFILSQRAGIALTDCSSPSVLDNVLAQNLAGLTVNNSDLLTLTGNRILSSSSNGVQVASGRVTARNNLIYANAGAGLDAQNPGDSVFENNTFYLNGGAGLRLAGNYTNTTRVANNILVASGAGAACVRFTDIQGSWVSDYNCYHALAGATLWDWKGPRTTLGALQHYTDRERRSLDRDPQFADPDGTNNVLGGAFFDDDDFRLATGSLCIDAGDLLSDYSNEPVPNGSRINLGHLGNTAQADLSPNHRRVTVLYPNGGEIGLREVRVRWSLSGPWLTNDTIKLEYSANGGATWSGVPGANPILGQNGYFGWSISSLAVGTNYRARVMYLADTNVNDASDASFQITAPAPRAFFVNDGALASDEFCTAIGTSTGTGLTASSPLDSVSLLLERYHKIGPGDEIRVDVGSFERGRMLYLVQANSGVAASNLAIRGAAGGTTLDGLGVGYDGLFLNRVSHFRLDRVNVTRSQRGIVAVGPAAGLTITGCVVYANTSDGVQLAGNSLSAIRNSSVCSNGLSGVLFSDCTNGQVVASASYNNGNSGVRIQSGVSLVVTNSSLYLNGAAGFDSPLRYPSWYCEVANSSLYGNGGGGISASAGTGHYDGSYYFRYSSLNIYSNQSYGLYGGTYATATNCDSWANDYGIGSVETSSYCRAYRNNYDGFSGIGVLRDCKSYENGYNGATFFSSAERCEIYRNGRSGISEDYYLTSLRNNLIYDNDQSFGGYYNVDISHSSFTMENNTLWGRNGLAITIGGYGCNITNRNNIIVANGAGATAYYLDSVPADFVSDYNNLYASAGANVGYYLGPRPTLVNLRTVTLKDAGSISTDPRLISAPTNFHPRSQTGSYRGLPFTAPAGGSFSNDADTSFCIDGGDPASAFASESAPNGSRVNQGAFGNLADASHSPTQRLSLVVDPVPGATWFGTQQITWLNRGPWTGGDTVSLYWSTNNGSSWSLITNNLAYTAGSYGWDVSGLFPGTNYLVKVQRSDGTAVDVSDAAFAIAASGPRTYYVNDAGTSGDIYCSAPGSDGNDGLSPATPKASLQAILDTYIVVGGDAVKVDTGNYLLSATVIVTTNDMGTAGNPILIVGSTNGTGTVFDRNNTTEPVVLINGADYIRVENLKLTRGQSGLRVVGTAGNNVEGIEVMGCSVYSCYSSWWDSGIVLTYVTQGLVSSCTIYSNTADIWHYAVFASQSRGITVSGNQVYQNYSGIYFDNSQGSILSNRVWKIAGYGIEAYPLDYVGSTNRILIQGNECFSNASHGIYGWHRTDILNNKSWANYYYGISAVTSDSNAVVSANTCFSNGWAGISVAEGTIQSNILYGNGLSGLQVEAYHGAAVRHNLVYDNGRAATVNYDRYNIRIGYHNGSYYHSGPVVTAEYNTVYGGDGIYLDRPDARTALRNNIMVTTNGYCIWVSITDAAAQSDINYNDYFATGSAAVGYWRGTRRALDEWQYISGLDGQSISTDPRFVDPDGANNVLGGMSAADDNFHLASTVGSHTGASFTATSTNSFATNAVHSPCIDAGLPSESAGAELLPNGGRVNLGAFGATADASLSREVREVILMSVDGGEVLRGAERVTWVTRGAFAPADTVAVAYSTNRVAWTPIASAALALDGYTDWNLSVVPAGTYYLRVLPNGPGLGQTSGLFRVLGNVPTNFYVNDASLVADVYCSAVGNDTNNGVTPATPKANLQQLMVDYTLVPGDKVYIDTGVWTLDASIEIRESGSAAASIRFIGSTHTNGTVFNRNNTSESALILPATDYVSIENLRVFNSFYGVQVQGSSLDACTGVEVVNCEIASNTEYLAAGIYATDAVECSFRNNRIHDVSYWGIFLQGRDSVAVGNEVRFNSTGIEIHGANAAVNNRVTGGSEGIVGDNGAQIEGNTVSQMDFHGIKVYGSDTLAQFNRVYSNREFGIYMETSGKARRNVVYSNGRSGIYVYYGGSEISHNLVYDNGILPGYWSDTAQIYADAGILTIEGNTLYGRRGIVLRQAPIAVTISNNIVWATGAGNHAVYIEATPASSAGFVSDYNNFYATDSAKIGYWEGNHAGLADWQHFSGRDPHSLSADPLFVDMDGPDNLLGTTNGLDDNFHLSSKAGSYAGLAFSAVSTASFTTNASHSPCVDAGAPSASVGSELAPNGGRINMGAFGGSADASLSRNAKTLTLVSIDGGEVVRGTRNITWLTTGPWATGDTVKIAYSANAGGTWTTLSGGSNVPFDVGTLAWNASGLTPGSNYRIRIVDNTSPLAVTSGLFRVLANTATVFYVNDSSVTDDVYCVTVGNEANNALTPATPKATIRQVLMDYTLMGDDVVYIDTGVWVQEYDQRMFVSGTPGHPIRFVGSTNSVGSVINRNDTSTGRGVVFYENDHLQIERLEITGANKGVSASGSSTNPCDDIQVLNCHIHNNAAEGVWMDRVTNVVVAGNLLHDQATGVMISNGDGLIASNEIHHLSGWGYIIYAAGTFRILDNYAYDTQGAIYVFGSPSEVSRNRVRNSQSPGFAGYDAGMYVAGAGSVVEDNVVYLCQYDGMKVSGATVRRNRIFSNNQRGLVIDSWSYGANLVVNNLVYDNDRSGGGYFNMDIAYYGDTVENNTIYGANGLRCYQPWSTRIRNNIIWAKGADRFALWHETTGTPATDWNNLYATDSASVGKWGSTACATFTNWQAVSGLDAHSLSVSPQFVDMDGLDDLLGQNNGDDDDFHLRSMAGSYHGGLWVADTNTSLCIDASDITTPFTNEPAFNGNRANQGAYGNTREASKTYYTGSFYKVTITNTPFYGGTVTIWPVTTNYMANQPARIVAVTNTNFRFVTWNGSVSSTNAAYEFNVGSSMVITGVFAVISGHEAAVYGNLGFVASTSSVMENAGSATIWVQRTNGLSGTVSVGYYTLPGTATKTLDYTTVSGTLSLAHGVASNSFVVPIIEDGITESNETVLLRLHQPGGGALLGGVTSAVLTIVEDDVPDPLLIATATLPNGHTGTAYNATLQASGGVTPYRWSAPGAMSYVESFEPNSFAAIGAAINLKADEGVRQIAVPFAFPFYGQSYTQLWVDTNGKIRFDSSSGDYTATTNELIAAKMIAVLWDDIDTGIGDVYVQTNATDLTIRWAGTYYDGPAVNFSLNLQGNGLIRMRYGVTNLLGGLIGISGGTGSNYLIGAKSQSGSLSNAQDIVITPANFSALPAGLLLSQNGEISGVPLYPGLYTVPFTVVDASGVSTSRTLSIEIAGGSPVNPDTDGDGLPDWWEIKYFGGPTNATPNGDGDGDHYVNLDEYYASTDPLINTSFLGLRQIQRLASSTGIVVRWQSASGKWYRVERSTNLIINPFPVKVFTNIPATWPENVQTDRTTVGNGPWYYRIRVER